MAQLDEDLQLAQLSREGEPLGDAVAAALASRRFARQLWRDLTAEERYVYRTRSQVPAWAELAELTEQDADHFQDDPGRAEDWPFTQPAPHSEVERAHGAAVDRPALGGARTLTTDVGGAVRGWLVWVLGESRLPLVLTLPDQPYGDEVSRHDAQMALNQASQDLHERLRHLEDEQLRAIAQQAESDYDGDELINRTLRYWDRPRLAAVDWLRVGPGSETARVAKLVQDVDWQLSPGDAVMLAGDSFADIHATVVEDESTAWLVRVHWEPRDAP